MPTFETIYSKGKNDECYTPEYGVKPILNYITPDTKIWCPFDKDDSNFVKILKANGNKVHNTHIDKGEDFYTYVPNFEWDVIISNPPFTNKAKIFKKALSYDKPFALIMSNTWLNDSAPKKIFKDKDLQLLMFEERMRFINPAGEVMDNKITFSSSYYCYKFLPKQIIMDSLKNYMQESR
jgi:hypothetical protein